MSSPTTSFSDIVWTIRYQDEEAANAFVASVRLMLSCRQSCAAHDLPRDFSETTEFGRDQRAGVSVLLDLFLDVFDYSTTELAWRMCLWERQKEKDPILRLSTEQLQLIRTVLAETCDDLQVFSPHLLHGHLSVLLDAVGRTAGRSIVVSGLCFLERDDS